jgi:hypothetical protein
MHLLGTNMERHAVDAFYHPFDPAGELGFSNEYSGIVPRKTLYKAFAETKPAYSRCVLYHQEETR